jgi:membrane associated rhomboid family serine protease
MTPWVFRLIVANVAVFLLEMANPGIGLTLALVPAQMLTHPWTVVTYMFVHAGPGHLFFNMLGLYFFGPRLELTLGSRRFLELYFTAGITGALLSLFTPNVSIVGASGAIFGVFYGYARYWPHDRILVWGIIPMPVWLFVLVMTGLSLYGGLRGSGGIAHFAHLGGFVGGYVYFRWGARRWGSAQFRTRAAPTPPRASDTDLERWTRIDRATMHPVNQEELDRVLAKVTANGPLSLTSDERAFLDRFSPA